MTFGQLRQDLRQSVRSLLLARLGVQALLRAYPTTLPRTSEVTVDPLVLLFTLGISMATGVIFGFAPIMHTRVKGLVGALKEGGARGATGAARNHVRRGLVMAEVALAVMLVIGAGLAGAFALNQLILSLLFGVQPTDPATLVGVIATILLVAAVACWIPAWRASRLDPNVVLRDD